MQEFKYAENQVIMLIGYNGTGKSSITHELLAFFREGNPRGPIRKWDPQRQFDGYGNIENVNPETWSTDLTAVWTKDELIKLNLPQYKEGHPKFCNGCLLLDDFRALYEGFQQPSGMKKFFIDKRFLNNTIIISVHTVGDVLELTKGYISKYYFFHTKTRKAIFNERLDFSDLCYDASLMVNAYNAQYGDQILHPNDKFFKGQSFPYAIIDTKLAPKQIFDCVNMHQPFYMNGKLMNPQ